MAESILGSYYKVVGRKLREAREKSNLSQEDVAKLLNSTNQKVSSFETGRTRVDLETLGALCKIYGISYSQILETTLKKEQLQLTQPEQSHITKYRAIDDKGKHTVDTVLEMEYNRCTVKEQQSAVKETPAPYHILNAAHADNYADAPDELKKQEEDIMDDENF